MITDPRLALEYARDDCHSALEVVQTHLRRHYLGVDVMSIDEHSMCKFAVKRYQECIENMDRMLLAMKQVDSARSAGEEGNALSYVEVDLQREINSFFAFTYPELQRRQKELCDRARGKLIARTWEPQRIIWRGPRWELAAHIIELHEKGELGNKGQSKREVVMQNADRFIFIDKNGNEEKVNPDSIWRNYFQRFR